MNNTSGVNVNYCQTIGFNYGWICPKCGHVYSPTQCECIKCNNTEYTITSTTIAKNDYDKWKETQTYYGKNSEE